MSETVNSGRSANKREVINISDDESNEPPVKKEPQGTFRLAGVAQARVGYLENLIDKKPATVDELQKKIDELERKLRQLDGRNKEQQKTIDELASKLAGNEKQLTEKYQKKIDDLANKCEGLAIFIVDDESKKSKLKEEHQKKIDELERKLYDSNNADKILVREQQKRIEELSLELKQYEDGQPLFEAEPKKIVRRASRIPSFDDYLVSNTGGIDHSKNIFKLYRANTPGTVSIYLAYAELQAVEKRVAASRVRAYEMLRRRKELFDGEMLDCVMCQKTYESDHILTHFDSQCHKDKVNYRHNPYISRAALDFWINKLESLTTTKATAAVVTVAPITVDPYALAVSDGESSDEEDDEEEEINVYD